MKVRERLRRVWWAFNGIEQPHPLDMKHFYSTSSACWSGRHWNCGVLIYRFSPVERVPCTCPCHRK